jgi:hypothetical protein
MVAGATFGWVGWGSLPSLSVLVSLVPSAFPGLGRGIAVAVSGVVVDDENNDDFLEGSIRGIGDPHAADGGGGGFVIERGGGE